MDGHTQGLPHLHQLRCQLRGQPLQARGYASEQAARVAHTLRPHLLQGLRIRCTPSAHPRACSHSSAATFTSLTTANKAHVIPLWLQCTQARGFTCWEKGGCMLVFRTPGRVLMWLLCALMACSVLSMSAASGPSPAKGPCSHAPHGSNPPASSTGCNVRICVIEMVPGHIEMSWSVSWRPKSSTRGEGHGDGPVQGGQRVQEGGRH